MQCEKDNSKSDNAGNAEESKSRTSEQNRLKTKKKAAEFLSLRYP